MADGEVRTFDAKTIDPRVRLAMRVLEFEQAVVPGIDTLATRVGLSPFHLSRLFAEQVGESCAAYSRRIRLDQSNNYLVHDPAPIGLVAATFGYTSQAAFTRAYTRQFGMAPRRYVATVLGRTQVEHAASHLEPIEEVEQKTPLLRSPVRLVERASRPALVRRFYGHDLAGHWRQFLHDLPSAIRDTADWAGMSYDNATVTPPQHWRYDCAAVMPVPHAALPAFDAASGLDAVEVPLGLHAEAAMRGDWSDLWRTTIGLFTEWLPANRSYQPEGDPVIHWLAAPPTEAEFDAVATIRIAPRGTVPEYNMRPLTRHGRPAGRRAKPGQV